MFPSKKVITVTEGARPSESQHWYSRDGTPAYEVASNGAVRPATLRDARKLGLVPSVTMIIRHAAAPGLEVWKRRMVAQSALMVPIDPTVTDEQWVAKVLEKGDEYRNQAAERGTQIHAAIQSYYEGKEIDPAHPFWPQVFAVKNNLDIRYNGALWVVEKSFAHPSGFGGKVDMHSSDIVLDVKSKEFAPGRKDLAWDEHVMQLAAYRMGLGLPHAKCVNVFVSTSHPGVVTVYEWEEEDVQRGWEMFLALFNYWRVKNRFDPSF